MKKGLPLLVVLIVLNLSVGKSCDVCGGIVSGGGPGFLANRNMNLIGLSWQHSVFKNASALENDLLDEFYFFELSAQYFLTKRIKVNIHQPYQLNIRHLDGKQQRTNGLGDTKIIGSYVFLQNKSISKESNLFVDGGLGIKTPVGKYNPDIHDSDLPDNFNVGNGSFGLLVNSNLVWTHKKIGFSCQVNLQQHFKSTSGYHFGHQLGSQIQCFLERAFLTKIKIIPAAGLRTEWIGADKYANEASVHGTGGYGTFGMASINFQSDKWLASCSYLQPVSQEYGGGEIQARGRFTCQVSLLF